MKRPRIDGDIENPVKNVPELRRLQGALRNGDDVCNRFVAPFCFAR